MALGIGSPKSNVMNLVPNARKLGETGDFGYTWTNYEELGEERGAVFMSKPQALSWLQVFRSFSMPQSAW